MLLESLVVLFAGIGAGAVTGLIGASAVVVVTPVLITVLGYNPYTAIGISLVTDVFASSVSAATYWRNGNIRIRGGLTIAFTAVLAAVVGSWLSGDVDPTTLGGLSGVVILLMGVSFTRKSLNERLESFRETADLSAVREHKTVASALAGGFIGTMTGVFGAGGGVMILIILTFILEYEVHTAVGTSVLIMIFTALSGGVSHFIVESAVPFAALGISGIGGIVGAFLAARYANLVSEERLSTVIGMTFVGLGGFVVLQRLPF
ncbi:permease [Halogeometricum borinquense DSM 11551]|uniref:Probable membrane transporter protein n=2 Tax=Halogeometricum borinquense TaxID=60847 RepID=E4NVV3_HALBP|nr:sulfite exporter TauE/SafE family protein [Halogeometricum borinquense]ADQ69173.1 predicted permease [Halogeometricum borinquense DSM 11551]ELY31721.1 permease [Halogeometricum borinquense DSM 11551]RYJ07728.1 sulfite exporter TauE/SafE family protein [Halogeometricum borinquense]